MARARVGLPRKSGINPVPIVIFVVVAALVGGGLFTWDYLWRRQQEEATRPPAPEVLVRNLIENIIGKDTVKVAKIDAAAGTVSVTFESATFKPDEAEKDPAKFAQNSREFLSAEAKLASDAILNPPEQLFTQVPVFQQLRKISLTIVYKGATLATATAERGKKDVQVTYVDSRLK